MPNDTHQIEPTQQERELALRRVAILLSSLPAPTASKVLQGIDPQSRQLANRAIETLVSVDSAERSEVVDLFKNSMEGRTVSRFASESFSGIEDEFVSGEKSPTSGRPSISVRAYPQATTSKFDIQRETKLDSLQFLESLNSEQLSCLLSDEHPQTIALVLASLPPSTAASTLPLLESQAQCETLSRIGRLEEVDSTTVMEVASQLREKYSCSFSQHTTDGGKRALDAILAEMPELGQTLTQPPLDSSDAHEPSAPSLRIAEVSIDHADDDGDIASEEPSKPENVNQIDVDIALLQLTPSELFQALGQVSTRDALLTLCGLPASVSERTIAMLPRRRAKQVRDGIENIGPLQLSEVDRAKRVVVEFAQSVRRDVSTTSQAA